MSHPPALVCSFIFTRRGTDMGRFLALGYEGISARASVRFLALASGRPEHYGCLLYALICVCVM